MKDLVGLADLNGVERTDILCRIPGVERENAGAEALAFYDKAEARFERLLNVFKVFGHQPEYGRVFTDTIMAILKDGVLDWPTKEMLILKTTLGNRCAYCVVQHERVSEMLGMPAEKMADLEGERYRASPHFSVPEKALLDLAVQMREDATQVPAALWARLRRHWEEPQIVDAAFVIATYTAVSKFVDALGVELEPEFEGAMPQLMMG